MAGHDLGVLAPARALHHQVPDHALAGPVCAGRGIMGVERKGLVNKVHLKYQHMV